MEKLFEVSGMHCQSCVMKLTDTLQSVDGVAAAVVSLDPPYARIEGADVDPHRIADAVASAGDYRAREVADASVRTVPGAGATAADATATYYPLILIVAFLLAGSAILQLRTGTWIWMDSMSDFMGGFFIVFGFFKLLDVRGFADAYQNYDLIAARLRGYGLAYPFVEISLGVAYLFRFAPIWTNAVTLIVMIVGSAGVLRSLLQRQPIQCACLGTVFNLPMSKVTLVEDVGMAAMAALMIAVRFHS